MSEWKPKDHEDESIKWKRKQLLALSMLADQMVADDIVLVADYEHEVEIYVYGKPTGIVTSPYELSGKKLRMLVRRWEERNA